MSVFVRTLADIFREKNVPLEEFPALFVMEAHTGYAGVMFGSLWFAIIATDISYMAKVYWIFAIVIIFVFFVLSWLSLALANYFSGTILELSPSDSLKRQELELQVRYGITLLSASYVIVFCMLIGLTGGIGSPFVPLYVMTFTLTISKIAMTPRTLAVSAYYLLALLAAFLSAELWPIPAISDLKQSQLYTVIQMAFTCASLIIPTISLYLIRKRQATRSLLEQMAASDQAIRKLD